MNLAVDQQHIMQAIDWSRFNLEGWLYQFGAWMFSASGTCGKSINPIAIAMDQAVIKRKKFKLGVKKSRQVVADYMLSDIEIPKISRKGCACEITDNEARAVQRLILDMQGKSEVMDDWMDAIICRYFYGNSWAEMVTNERSQMEARMDVKCGLAALHSRYGFIKIN